MKNQKTKPYFLWEYEFEEVFEKNKGFDIVIANPPYIQLQKNKGKLANELVEQNFKTFERTGDIYCLFYEQGLNILRDNGVLTYITSNKWMRAGYGESLREYLSTQSNPLKLIDFGGTKVFSSATVDVYILILNKNTNQFKTNACVIDKTDFNNIDQFVRNNSVVNSSTIGQS